MKTTENKYLEEFERFEAALNSKYNEDVLDDLDFEDYEND